MSLAQFSQAIDIISRLSAFWEVHESPFLIRLVGAIDLIEPVRFAFLRMVNEALPQEDREGVVAVELLDPAILHLAKPLQGVPVKTLAGVACHHGTEYLQLSIRKLTDLVIPLSFQLIFSGSPFSHTGEVLVWRQLILDTELLSDGQNSSPEPGTIPPMDAHPCVDGVQVFIITAEVVDYPKSSLVLSDGGRCRLLGETHVKLFFVISAVLSLRIEV